LQEFLRPERIVLGYENERSRRLLDDLFAGFLMEETAICHVSWEAAEMMRTAGGTLAVSVPLPEKSPARPDYTRIAVGS
jgi:UDP-glucose 6-dehydrogenase